MRRISLPLLAALFAAAPAPGQGWPARPLRFIVPQAQGSTPDIAARAIAGRLLAMLGQNVLIENLARDSGPEAAARAKADGYTYLFASASMLVIDPYLVNILPYSPEDDFATVAMVGLAPFALGAIPDLNVKSLGELIAFARDAPDRLALANPGKLTLPGMLGDLLRNRAGISLLRVGFTGSPDSPAGRAHLVILGIPAIAAAVERGRLRALAVSSARRLAELREVATFSEALRGFEVNDWYMIVAPTHTPQEAIRRMNLEINRALLDADIKRRLRAVGIYSEGSDTPERLDAFLDKERAFWGGVVRELKLEP